MLTFYFDRSQLHRWIEHIKDNVINTIMHVVLKYELQGQTLVMQIYICETCNHICLKVSVLHM